MYQLAFTLAVVSHCCDRTYQKYEVLKISYCSDNIVLNNATVKMELKLVSWESVLKVKDEANISSYCIVSNNMFYLLLVKNRHIQMAFA